MDKQFKSSPFMRALAAGIQSCTPTMLWGDPGEAKSATIADAGRQWGRHVEVINGSTREAPDFLGVMAEDADGETISYKPFKWVKRLNEGAKSLLVLEEINRSAIQTMNAQLRALQEKVVGETPLREGTSIVAIANSPEGSPEVEEFTSAMANRLMHLDWEFDDELWMDNLSTSFQHVEYDDLAELIHSDPASRRAIVAMKVLAYLKHDPTKLKPGVPKNSVKAAGAWPSPRSWDNAVTVMSHLQPGDDEAEFLVMQGCVGKDVAKQYFAFIKDYDLVNPLDAMKDPSSVEWAEERTDRLFVLLTAIAALGLAKKERWKPAVMAAVACANGGKPDVALVAARKLFNAIPDGVKIPRAAADAFSDLLTATGYGIKAA